MFLCIGIPGEYFVCGIEELEIPTANYILQLLFPAMSELSDEYRNDKKDAREKARHASGSVSQGANIVEAIGCGVKLLLIDEDKSATNFMIRDKVMRKIVPNEPIIPFTDRIEELNKNCGMSMILVIGGSAEYLAYADIVILMEDYEPK